MTPRDVPLPPRPGPRPSDFEFPFAEARAAMQAMEDLASDVTSMIRTHRSAAASARVGWKGWSRDRFDRAFTQRMEQFTKLRRRLTEDARTLEEAIATAQQRQRESQDAIASWERSVWRYNDAVAQARAQARTKNY